MTTILRLYQRALSKRPLVTQMISSGVIGATGDIVCQLGVEKRSRDNYDFSRTGRFFLLTSCFITPILSRWMIFLEKRIHGSPKLVPLKRVLVDQACFAPVFSASIIYNLHFFETFSTSKSWEFLKRNYWEIYKHSILYWPFVQIVNFYFVPLNFRVVLIQIAALAWNTFLSYKTQVKIPLPPLE
ncbi:hypothetical protein FO519_004824 [Halicephalobus sp. NKZ332]|nr:hypothetical protein FO519_004824 [Halicephalobus sp. NKZ332]